MHCIQQQGAEILLRCLGCRESKLTRLLQESLGGRTKTLIIATVASLFFYIRPSSPQRAFARGAEFSRPYSPRSSELLTVGAMAMAVRRGAGVADIGQH